MPCFAKPLCGILGSKPVIFTERLRASHVFEVGNDLKVVQPDASRNSAKVIEFIPVRHRPHNEIPEAAMGSASSLGERERPIAPSEGSRSPKPAITGRIDFVEEAFKPRSFSHAVIVRHLGDYG